jgi:hypothetical protein
MHKINLIYTHKESIFFPVPIIMGLTNLKQHDLQVSYIELLNFIHFLNNKWAE